MLSKYEESARNVDKIENVVGAMMEKLGVGGFMGIQDIKQGMYCTIRQLYQESQLIQKATVR